MTTIAFSGGIVAADSRIMRAGRASPEHAEKVWRLEHGGVGAAVGSLWSVEEFHEWLNRGQKAWEKPKLEDDTIVIEFLRGGAILEYTKEGRVRTNPTRGFYAWGSGADYAYGALAMGASAVRAVNVAIEFDPSTGGEVQWLKVVRDDEEDGA